MEEEPEEAVAGRGKDIKLSWVSLCRPLPTGGEISVAALLLVCKTHSETQRMWTFSIPRSLEEELNSCWTSSETK